MRGDATLFTRRDEVEAEWRIITPIEEAWTQLQAPEFPNYAAGGEPTLWHELLGIDGSIAERSIGYGKIVSGFSHACTDFAVTKQ
jgi:glucose-6-phosphate 1-dehydrogenase